MFVPQTASAVKGSCVSLQGCRSMCLTFAHSLVLGFLLGSYRINVHFILLCNMNMNTDGRISCVFRWIPIAIVKMKMDTDDGIPCAFSWDPIIMARTG